MSFDSAFSGVTKAQRTLVEYWNCCCDAHGRVSRSDIDPGRLRAHLSSMSVVSIRPRGQAVFRIMGSRLRDVLGYDPRGKTIADVLGSKADAFALTLGVAIDQGLPVGGIIQRKTGYHTWLRMPLLGQHGQQPQVLCHDEIITNPDHLLDPTDTIVQHRSLAA